MVLKQSRLVNRPFLYLFNPRIMIQPHELRIGNLVFDANHRTILINRNHFTGTFGGMRGIFITELVFKQLGILYRKRPAEWSYNEYVIDLPSLGKRLALPMDGVNKYCACLFPFDDEGSNITGAVGIPCPYIHNLQNLVYALTGHELQTSISQ